MKSLPTDDALAALGLANCRDVASACRGGGIVVPGRLFRSSSPFSLSKSSKWAGGGEDNDDDDDENDGDDGDDDVAAEERARRLSHAAASPSSKKGLGLTLVIDLRSDNEWEQGKGDAVVEALLLSAKKKKMENEQTKNETTTATIVKVERVPLQSWRRYTHAFVARLPLDRALGAAAHFALFKFVLRCEPPLPGMHARLCLDAERGGVVAMNTAVLAAFPSEIARVLRLVSSALSNSDSRSSSPSPSVMIACKLGKDRTGVAAALCLAVAGASRRDVVDDYARSAAELRGRPPPATAPSLGGAPRSAMERTLDWLAEHWGSRAPREEVESYDCGGRREEEEEEEEERKKKGDFSSSSSSSSPRYCWRSGVIGYLEHEARFLAHERAALRRALTE